MDLFIHMYLFDFLLLPTIFSEESNILLSLSFFILTSN